MKTNPKEQYKKPNIKKPFKNRPKVVRFNITNLLFIIGGVIVVYLLISSLYQPSLGREVTFDKLVANILGNQYSQVDVRDDGKVVSYDKYVDVAIKKDDTDYTYDVTDRDVDYMDNLEEVTVDGFLEKIKTPTTIAEWKDVLTRKTKLFTVEEVLFGTDFVIIKQAGSEGGDLIIRNTNEEEFSQQLIDENIAIEDVSNRITYLRSASRLRDKDMMDNVLQNDKYSDIWDTGDFVIARLKDNEINTSYALLAPLQTDFVTYLKEQGFNIDDRSVEIVTVSIPIIPWGDLLTFGALLGLGLLMFMLFRGIQGSGNSLMKFGQTKAGVFFGRKPEITFKDVAGVDEAKEELKEVVMFLKSPQKFLKLGARIPKGLLLVGQPGTGKTLLARAIAGEAGVPFFHTSGSEFEEMLVGAGASRVRDLFEKAKKASPSIVFIDEIDAVARKRGTTVQSSSTEQTLNQILVEMDGFERKDNVIVIAATNRPDVLDPAILRPGRFDRRVVLDLPDIEGRVSIIKIHASNKPLASDVDLEKVAKRTVGFSGADLENMLNEAAIIAAKADRKEITAKDIEEAATKVVVGPERRRKRSEDELKMTAYHEAGHAIIAKLSPKSDPVHRITIISRGMSLGSTMQLPQDDKLQQTKTELESTIKVLLAGRAAEEIIFDDITGGASNDIEKATSIARKMIKLLGMSKSLGLVKYGQSNELQYLGYGYGEQRDYSEKTSELIDDEVRSIIAVAYEEVKKMLTDNIGILHQLSELLLEKEVVEGVEFEEIFSKKK